MYNLNDILFNQDEKIVSVLGNNLAQKFISTGKIGDGFAVLSDKRLYFKGKCFYKKNKGFYKKSEEKAVDLKDVTGTGFEHYKPIGLLIGGIACVVLGVLLFILTILMWYSFRRN